MGQGAGAGGFLRGEQLQGSPLPLKFPMQAGLGTKRWSHTTSYYLGNLLRRDIVRQIEQLAVVKAEDGDTDNPSVIVRWKAKLPAIVRASIGSYRNQLILVYDSFRVDCGPLSMPAPVARLRRNQPFACHGSKESNRPEAAMRRPHSITSSARARSNCGTVRPSALAVFRLMISSNLVACWTGRSAGLAPLRIFPT